MTLYMHDKFLLFPEGLNYSSDDVAILFSNRAACYLKIGDCHSCVADCNTAITMAPTNSYKPLLRRALAYETMEKLVIVGIGIIWNACENVVCCVP